MAKVPLPPPNQRLEAGVAQLDRLSRWTRRLLVIALLTWFLPVRPVEVRNERITNMVYSLREIGLSHEAIASHLGRHERDDRDLYWNAAVQTIQSATSTFALLLLLAWLYRAHANLRLVGTRHTMWPPLLAALAWCVPVLNLFATWTSLHELGWRSYDGNVHRRLRRKSTSAIRRWRAASCGYVALWTLLAYYAHRHAVPPPLLVLVFAATKIVTVLILRDLIGRISHQQQYLIWPEAFRDRDEVPSSPEPVEATSALPVGRPPGTTRLRVDDETLPKEATGVTPSVRPPELVGEPARRSPWLRKAENQNMRALELARRVLDTRTVEREAGFGSWTLVLFQLVEYGVILSNVDCLVEARRGGGLAIGCLRDVARSLDQFMAFNSVVLVATIVLWIWWQHRAYVNLAVMGSGRTNHPVRSAWLFSIVPLVNLVVPYFVLKELWIRSRDGNATHKQGRRESRGSLEALYAVGFLAGAARGSVYVVLHEGSVKHPMAESTWRWLLSASIGASLLLSLGVAILACRFAREVRDHQTEAVNRQLDAAESALVAASSRTAEGTPPVS